MTGRIFDMFDACVCGDTTKHLSIDTDYPTSYCSGYATVSCLECGRCLRVYATELSAVAARWNTWVACNHKLNVAGFLGCARGDNGAYL